MKHIPLVARDLIIAEFNGVDEFNHITASVCRSCHATFLRNSIPKLSVTNGFVYPPIPSFLPKLNPVSERLISPRIPFLQIRRLRHAHGQYGVVGQIINVPVEVNTMVQQLPRSLSDDYCINVNIKKCLCHKSSFLSGYVQKHELKKWLQFLVNQQLYKLYNISVKNGFLGNPGGDESSIQLEGELIESTEPEDFLIATQETLLWNEESYLSIAPGEKSVPLSILFDEHSEELSFPSIYLGEARTFKEDVRVTPFMVATFEIWRADRRGACPNHLLYMVMKILRFRVKESLTIAFKYISADTKISK